MIDGQVTWSLRLPTLPRNRSIFWSCGSKCQKLYLKTVTEWDLLSGTVELLSWILMRAQSLMTNPLSQKKPTFSKSKNSINRAGQRTRPEGTKQIPGELRLLLHS